MTKRAVLIGLAMAVIVLIILFAFFRPDTSQAPAGTADQQMQSVPSGSQDQSSAGSSSSSVDSNSDDLNSLNSDLDSLDADINSDQGADTTGL